LSDFDELYTTGTDPLDVDTDSDGCEDLDELETLGTDPLIDDTDGDGLFDCDEVALGTDPLVEDSDDDGLSDGEEVGYDGSYDVGTDTDPLNADTDGDGYDDQTESEEGTSATDSTDYPRGGYAGGCSATGAGSGGWAWLLLAGLFARRTRSELGVLR
jgi:MYXO-CTERM domain-containing protein